MSSLMHCWHFMVLKPIKNNYSVLMKTKISNRQMLEDIYE